MAAGYVPSSPINTLLSNTTAGTVASPDAIDGAVTALQQTINDNYDFTAGLISAGVLSKLGIINVKDYNAKGDGTTDDTAAFQAALTAILTAGGGTLWIPYATYLLNLSSTLTIPSNCTIYNFGILNMGSSSITCFTATSKNNIRFVGGQINGTGVSGAARIFDFTSCTDSIIEKVKIRDGSAVAVRFTSCSNCVVQYCDIQESYYYSIEDKLGIGNVFTHNELSNNGYGASTAGRGITVWMCDGAEISYNKVKNNNEYGIRVYTETADASPTKKVFITGNECVDNATIDIYIYAEATPKDVIVSGNAIEQTTDSAATGMSIQGNGIQVINNILRKPGTTPTGSAFIFFGATKCSAKNNKIFGYFTAFNMSSTTKPSDCVIEGNEAYDIKDFVPMYGTNNIVRNNTAVHKGSAASGEIGYQQTDNSTGCVVDGNKFTGFHSAILLDFNVDIVIKNNIARSSVHSNIRTSVFDFHSMEMYGNDWDDFASSGQEILRSLEVRNGRYSFVVTDIPSTSLTSHVFAVGDYAKMRTPVAGGNLAWVCTTAGTPGTWKTAGTIGA